MKAIEGLRILVVEDDLSLLRILATVLRRKGALVQEASNGQQGLDTLASHQIDLVLSDVQMPIMDGLELLATIRSANPRIPVVLFVTGQAQLKEEESLMLGAAGLLRKPVRFAALVEKVEELIASGVLHRAS